jgi:hypothetical protein
VAAVEGLGINWGTQATHPLPPKAVVQLLKDNGIAKVKLFDTDFAAMSALAGSGVEVMVAIPNKDLATMASDYGNAKDWVKKNVKRFDFDGGVTIKYVAVGNEPFLKAYNGSFINITLPALQNVQNALNDAGIGDRIKATVPLNADVYESTVPSAGRFRPEIAGLMTDIVKFLAKNNAPFTVNIYPFLSLYLDEHFPINFAFFDGGSTPVNDGGIMYTNVFDANFDTLVAALKAVGHGDMPIIVGEVGWPTDGDKNARVDLAQRFYAGLLKRLAANVGTPARPNQYIEMYLFGLVDEDMKSVAPGSFERHWGVFNYDGSRKYNLRLAGGRSIAPARGVRYLSRQWCVLRPDASPADPAIGGAVGYACQYADCTSLGAGSSCGGLDARGNVSYAFNQFFQAANQMKGSCNFNNLSMITTSDPSQGTCRFQIEIDTGRHDLAVASSASAAATSVAAVLLLALLGLVI